jgi:hypothetical protein
MMLLLEVNGFKITEELIRNVIILSPPEFTALQPVMPMQVMKAPGQEVESLLESRFPDATICFTS